MGRKLAAARIYGTDDSGLDHRNYVVYRNKNFGNKLIVKEKEMERKKGRRERKGKQW